MRSVLVCVGMLCMLSELRERALGLNTRGAIRLEEFADMTDSNRGGDEGV